MVKADAKHDYYADLQVAPDADQDTIKRQFRLLAKQYHPDRNPGRETEVVAKFQAVQAAHEVLCDAQQKAKYDGDRAKYIRKTEPEPFNLKRAHTTREAPLNHGYRPTSKHRNGSVDASTRSQQTSTSAEKFAHFTRAAQWERAKYEDATAGAEALRNFHSMRGQQQAPPHPPRPPRPPTAPKSSSTATSPDYSYANGGSPGFPGMSRTQSIPKRQGFSPATPGSDEPPARSAYAYVHSNRDKPWPYQNVPPQPSVSQTSSPPLYRARPAEGTLRPSQSGDSDNTERPILGRTSSRYATHGGEKTSINRDGLGRSASVRNSPDDRNLGDHGPFGARARSSADVSAQAEPSPRHRSASPKMRPPAGAQFEFSATETSSSEDESENRKPRPKAVPRSAGRPRAAERSASNDPALMGQFPNTNYTRHVDESRYNYPPPEDGEIPYQRPFDQATPNMDGMLNDFHATGVNDRHNEVPHTSHSASDIYGSFADGHHQHQHHHQSSFSASDWDGKFKNSGNIFAPSDRDRKSPTKTSRSRTNTKPRPYTVEVEEDSEEVSPTMPNDRTGTFTSPSSNGAFQRATFSADDWAKRLHSQNINAAQPATARVPGLQPPEIHVEADSHNSDVHNQPEPMDIDSLAPGSQRPIHSIRINPSSRKNSSDGVDLSDLAQAAPFTPSADGLNSLSSDMANSLPFKSRAADQVQYTGPSGAALRNMTLPKPPKPILAPTTITQESWEIYWRKMQQYMRDWNVFNSKMIEHFRARQEQIDHNMYQNWVMGEGEGANAEDVDGSDITSPQRSPGNGHHKAGYHTYMQWLEQDALCRHWWDAAFDEHRECLEDLGSTRRKVKEIRERQN